MMHPDILSAVARDRIAEQERRAAAAQRRAERDRAPERSGREGADGDAAPAVPADRRAAG
ncbi:hypothetical protein ACFOVU_22860 [Nocardiopsis sediminis]|uniref:Uncharacterized protein n=1 Tax=Nocardiopsis sediminis TaxID=1778267 RepID=A0ABV8FRI5_9ACTN